MKRYAFYCFMGVAGAFVASGLYSHHREQAAKWAAFQKFPYLDVRDDWCTSRKVHPRHCLTPGNLAKLVTARAPQ